MTKFVIFRAVCKVIIGVLCFYGLVFLTTSVVQKQPKSNVASIEAKTDEWRLSDSLAKEFEMLRPSANDESMEEWAITSDIESIRIQEWGPPDSFLRTPGQNRTITLFRNGRAEYLGISGFDRLGKHEGKVNLFNYGKICVLLKCFLGNDLNHGSIGEEAYVSHPTTTEITVQLISHETPLKYRNEYSFGDFKFWVIECAIIKTVDEIAWSESK